MFPKFVFESLTTFLHAEQFGGLKGTFRNEFAIVCTDGLLGLYYCLFLVSSWPSDDAPGDFHLIVENTGENLMVMV